METNSNIKKYILKLITEHTFNDKLDNKEIKQCISIYKRIKENDEHMSILKKQFDLQLSSLIKTRQLIYKDCRHIMKKIYDYTGNFDTCVICGYCK